MESPQEVHEQQPAEEIPFKGQQDGVGDVEGLMPSSCGGQRYSGPSSPVGAGNNGMTFKVTAQDDVYVVAKAATNSEFDEEENFKAAQNECAVMKLLEASAAPNMLRCLGQCRGSYRGEQDKEDREAGIIVTAPYFEDAVQPRGRDDDGAGLYLEDARASARAMRETFYAAVYMIAVGVVNGDLARNMMHKSDGDSLIIDLGLARILVPDANASLKNLGLDDFGFVEGESLRTLPASDDKWLTFTMRNHIDAAVFIAYPLGVEEVESLWRNAWSVGIAKRRFATSSAADAFWTKIGRVADETFHGRLLHHLISTQFAPSLDEIALALTFVPRGQDGGEVWAHCKTKLVERAAVALDIAEAQDNDTTTYTEIIRLLKNT